MKLFIGLNGYKETNALITLIETIVVTGTGFLLGHYFLPETPFFATHGFTWLVVGPLLIGLRYGFAYALGSVVLTLVLLLVAKAYQLPWAQGSIPTIGLALLMMAFVAGEFSNYWKRRLKKLEASFNYLDQRLNQTFINFNILEKSHQRMEQSVVSHLAGYIGDVLGDKISPAFTQINDQYLRCFLLKLQRCIQNVTDYAVPSAIIRIEFKNPQNFNTLKSLFLNNKRNLDESWEGVNQQGKKVILLLLPLTTNAVINSYKSRLESLLRERFSVENFQAAGISFHQHKLLPTDNAVNVIYETTMPKTAKNLKQQRLEQQTNYAVNY